MAGRPTKEPGQKMDIPLRIMLIAEQDRLIRKAAAKKGIDVSTWARPTLLEAARKSVGIERIAVRVGELETVVDLVQLDEGKFRIKRFDCLLPSRPKSKVPARELFPEVSSAEEAANHVADLIRKGIIRPDSGFNTGVELERFDFPD